MENSALIKTNSNLLNLGQVFARFLHTKFFTHKGFTHKDFTHKGFTHKGFTHKDFTHKGFTHKGFYTQTFLHTKVLQHKGFYTQSLTKVCNSFSYIKGAVKPGICFVPLLISSLCTRLL